MTAIENKTHLMEVCNNDSRITNLISSEIIEEAFKPENHLGFSGLIVDNTISKARLML